MLKSINDMLKTMGEALAFANAGEMLTEKQKARVLAPQQKRCSTVSDAMLSQGTLASDEAFATETVDGSVALCH